MHNKIKYTALFFSVVLLLTACKKDDIDPPLDRTAVPRTLGQFIDNNYNFSLLKAAIEKAGLRDTLNKPNAGTFFAPDNYAFNNSGIFEASAFNNMSADSLRRVLLSHMLPQRYFVSEFPAQMGTQLVTKAGSIMYVSVSPIAAWNGPENRNLTVNGANILTTNGIQRNIALTNGVIHIPGKLMKHHQGTVQDFVAGDTSLTFFAAAMKRFNFWDGLKTSSPITLYAPNNQAFRDRGIGLDSIMRMSPDTHSPDLFAIYHFNMAPKRIFSTDGWLIHGTVYRDNGIRFKSYSVSPNFSYNPFVSPTPVYELMIAKQTGVNIWSNNPDGPVQPQYDKDGPKVNADHAMDNGVVHVINTLMLHPEFFRK
jgi:uncharacterized surface protein with fasciclin (FAS1) repeats